MSRPAQIADQTPMIRSLFSPFDKLGDPAVNEFTSSVPEHFEEVVASVLSRKTLVNDFILSNRIRLQPLVEKFHREAGTFTERVQESNALLNDPTARIVVSAHQPNLFAYGGIFKKIVLLECLGDRVRSRDSDGRVINLFLLVDHDFVDETWIRNAQLPSVFHTSGIMELKLPVPDSRRWQMVCNVPLPGRAIVGHWKHQVKSWIKSCTHSDTDERKRANSNFEEFWRDVVETSYDRAKNYSDFNAFVLTGIVNRVWKYGTIFVRLSELSPLFENGFTFLLSNFKTYSDGLRFTESRLMGMGIDTGISASSFQSAPIWIHCPCGSKASVRLVKDGRQLVLQGPCLSCKKEQVLDVGDLENLDLSKTAQKMSPRAIPIPLLLSRDFGIDCYASGTGGIGYLVDGSALARRLSIKFPVVAVWSSKDMYRGIGQTLAKQELHLGNDVEASLKECENSAKMFFDKIAPLLSEKINRLNLGVSIDGVLREIFLLKEEQRRIRKRINALARVRNIELLSPCIIDYAVNFGMAQTERTWRSHLKMNGSLASAINFQ